MKEPNAVFDLMRGFRAAAYRAQKWLTLAGLALLLATGLLAGFGLVSAWAPAGGAGLLAAGVLWALWWRRRVEAAFWQGARALRRGAKLRLPVDAGKYGLALLLALVLGGPAAEAAEKDLTLRLSEGRGLDAAALLSATGAGGLIALAIGALALLLALYLLLSLWNAQFAPGKLRDELLEKLAIGDADGARRLCEADGSVLARATLVGMAGGLGEPSAAGRALPGTLMAAEAGRRLHRWRVLVDLLSAAGVIAPLAGMFGTMLGLIRAFAAVAAPELSPALLAEGAVSALAPAAAGVGAGLVALTAYYLADLRLAVLQEAAGTACAEVAAALADAAAVRAETAGGGDGKP